MKEYEIWMEGYAATGESGAAHCCTVKDADYIHGNMGTPYKIKADSFIEACEIYERETNDKLDRNSDGKLRLSGSEVFTQDGMIHVPMIWACRLFDNEGEARKSFG